MDKMKMSQIFKVFLMSLILCIIPLMLSSALKPPYLYFVVNLLVIVLGAEAGLLSFMSKTSNHQNQDKKTTTFHPHDLTNLAQKPRDKENPAAGNAKANPFTTNEVVGKSPSLKISDSAVSVFHKGLKKSLSTPSLFFIGRGDDLDQEEEDRDFMVEEDDHDLMVMVEEEDHENVDDNKELFHKAETFIGDFYKQLKMQREDSWKNIHDLYHKAF